jgi:hypothetical protein
MWRYLAFLIKKFDHKKTVEKNLLTHAYIEAIRNTEYVSSRGILHNTDIHNPDPKSSSINKDYILSIPKQLNEISVSRPLPSIYICTDEIDYFAKEALPFLQKKFVLVSGDSDVSLNPINFGGGIKEILYSHYLTKWYCQNLDFDHPKIEPIPIGMDYHTVWRDSRTWADKLTLPSIQEGAIKEVRKVSKSFAKRNDDIYCNWHFSLNHGKRREFLDKLNLNICYFQDKFLSRRLSWRSQSDFKFVLSPNGAGLDCHRTWEALILGCIPIIQNSLLAQKLYKNLPVIIIDDASDLNKSFLTKKLSEVNLEFDSNLLRLSYWVNKIHNLSF